MLHVDLIRGHELNDAIAGRWEQLRALNSRLYSPFYSFDFAKVVSLVRDDVEIGVIRENDEIVGIFPFHRIGRRGIPVGGKMNDAHGLIASPHFEVDVRWLLKKCRLTCWDFHAMFWPEGVGEKYAFAKVRSFMANLNVGVQPYRRQLEENNYTIEAHKRKARKFSKDHPGARLVLDCRELAMVDRLIQLKSEQYRRTHIFDIFSVPWTRDLVRTFLTYQGHSVRGCLSVLKADEQQIVAMHFGLREGDLLHYWFPVYETQFHQYSPGTELFLRIADEAPSHGIQRIDMGYGEQAYKEKLVNTNDVAFTGCLTTIAATWHLRHCRYRLRDQMKHIILKDAIKRGVRTIWPSLGRGQFQ